MYGMIPHRSERKLTEYLIRTLGVKDVFYDIGAHLGFYTALAETLLMEGKVFAFEANDTLCAYLNKNFGNESRVTVVCSAVASVPGTVEFYDATNTSDSSMSSRFNISGSIISTRKVSTVILDTFVTSAVTPPTIMKFDIEGGEYDAICGAEKIIQTFKPTIILEVWGGKLGRTYSQNAIEKLFALGYEAFSIGSNGMLSTEAVLDPVSSIVGTEEGVRDNFVFIHTEIRK
jgi:FkbM family methyltransferase